MQKQVLLMLGALSAFGAGNGVSAQTASKDLTLEEIVVTAEKRTDTIQNTPLSITAVSGALIDQQGRNDVNDILKDVPGVTLTNSAQGSNINIRGITSGSLPNNDADPGVSLNFDGAYASSLVGGASQASFYDIARVEVLRGPQGTLYGRNAEAGAVNVISNDPVDRYDASGTLEAGNYSLFRGSGMVNAPLSDSLALRGAFTTINRDGYYTSGGDDAVASAGRVKLQFKPSEDFRFLLGSEFAKQEGHPNVGGMGAGIPAWGYGDPPSDPYNDLTQDGGASGTIPGSTQSNKSTKVWAQVDWNVGIGTLTLLPAHVRSDTGSFTYSVPMGATSGPPYTQLPATGWARQNSAEARLASPTTSALTWIGGAFYSKAENSNTTTQFGPSTVNVDQDSKAVFGQATYAFTEAFHLTGGARETWDKKSFDSTASVLSGLSGPAAGAADWKRFDWKLGTESNLSANSLLYFNVATGYRPGAINTGSSSTVAGPGGTQIPNTTLFTKPEELLSFELGSKNQLLDNRLLLNGDVYYYDYKNRQYTNFNTRATAVCPNGQAPLSFGPDSVCLEERNANKVRMLGGELSSQWLLTGSDRIDVSLAYLDAQANESQQVLLNSLNSAGTANNTVDINGKTMPDSPKLQANGGYQHSFMLPVGSLTLRGDARYTSKSYLQSFEYLDIPSIAPIYVVPSHTLYDASINFLASDEKWSLNAYGKNLSQKAYKTFTDGSYTTVNAPRTYGVVFTAHM